MVANPPVQMLRNLITHHDKDKEKFVGLSSQPSGLPFSSNRDDEIDLKLAFEKRHRRLAL